jgi:hypothetical protein
VALDVTRSDIAKEPANAILAAKQPNNAMDFALGLLLSVCSFSLYNTLNTPLQICNIYRWNIVIVICVPSYCYQIDALLSSAYFIPLALLSTKRFLLL